MNGAIFRAWTEQMLAPALQPGDIVIMDNLPAHPVSSADIPPGDPAKGRMVAGIREAIEARGAELRCLPPHSPDLNPSGAERLIRSRRDRRPKAAEASRPSPSSRRSCARPPSAPRTGSGTPSANCSTCSRPPSAQTTSPTPAMDGQHEKTLVRFKSAGQVQRFLSVHDQINNLFHLPRDHVTAVQYRTARAQAFAVWAEVTSAELAA